MIKQIHTDDIYQCMVDLNEWGKKITIGRIAGLLDCSKSTIHCNMCEELKREKELLNQQLKYPTVTEWNYTYEEWCKNNLKKLNNN